MNINNYQEADEMLAEEIDRATVKRVRFSGRQGRTE